MQQPEYLYHYTTVDAFISIVEKQELWASNIFYLNDTAEFHLATTRAEELLRAQIDSETDTKKREELENMSGLLGGATSRVTRMAPYFVCSFSAKEDDLNQWRAYCRNGGVAIGFRHDDLEWLVERQGLGFAPLLVSCIYEEEEQRRAVHAAIHDAVKLSPGGRIGASMSAQEIDEFRAGVLELLLGKKAIKSKDFSGENEWRLIAEVVPPVGDDKRYGFRNCNGLVVPYWIIKLRPGKAKRIWKNARVIIGPSPHPAELKASIEALLVRYCGRHPSRVSNQVENSRVTYRYW